jgi:CO dehydrogenase/acetyl-CoA synthase gamma subunit (corrinoid Fe-S protein)
MAFATRLALREVKLEQCPPLLQPEYAERLGKLRELIEPLLTAEETGIKLDDEKCTGCGNRVVVCAVTARV